MRSVGIRLVQLADVPEVLAGASLNEALRATRHVEVAAMHAEAQAMNSSHGLPALDLDVAEPDLPEHGMRRLTKDEEYLNSRQDDGPGGTFLSFFRQAGAAVADVEAASPSQVYDTAEPTLERTVSGSDVSGRI